MFPDKTDSFLKGQDILYKQFNDISFYVEDEEQENFYFAVLKKLFPDIRLEKIFPLGGKTEVAIEALDNLGDKTKVFLVDLDFDGILDQKLEIENLFYLEKYSIENYMLELEPLRSIIVEQRPKIRINQLQRAFDWPAFLNSCKSVFSDLICCYLVIQNHSLGIENVKCDSARFVDFKATKLRPEFETYRKQIEASLKERDPFLDLDRELQAFWSHFDELEKALSNIPGKYLLKYLKVLIEDRFKIQLHTDSFNYRLATKCEFSELGYLRVSIGNFCMY